jgi:hypothetical protein
MSLVIGMKGKDGYGGGDDESGKIYFDAPSDYDMTDKKPGDEIEFVGTATVEEDGRLCLKKMDGMDVGGEGEKPNPADKKNDYEGGFADAVMPEEGGDEGGEEAMQPSDNKGSM